MPDQATAATITDEELADADADRAERAPSLRGGILEGGLSRSDAEDVRSTTRAGRSGIAPRSPADHPPTAACRAYTFNLQRNLISRSTLRIFRAEAATR